MGRLPLITSSVIEYSNGDEVPVKLTYERLERHCSCCIRLDHEFKDCFEAKAQKRVQAEREYNVGGGGGGNEPQGMNCYLMRTNLSGSLLVEVMRVVRLQGEQNTHLREAMTDARRGITITTLMTP